MVERVWTLYIIKIYRQYTSRLGKPLQSHLFYRNPWLSNDADLSLFKLDNYNIISKGKTCSAHGGLVIYLHNSYRHKNISPIDKFKIG